VTLVLPNIVIKYWLGLYKAVQRSMIFMDNRHGDIGIDMKVHNLYTKKYGSIESKPSSGYVIQALYTFQVKSVFSLSYSLEMNIFYLPEV
jgi:hypothetical protein